MSNVVPSSIWNKNTATSVTNNNTKTIDFNQIMWKFPELLSFSAKIDNNYLESRFLPIYTNAWTWPQCSNTKFCDCATMYIESYTVSLTKRGICLVTPSDVDSMHILVFFYCTWNVFNKKWIVLATGPAERVDPYCLSPTLCDSNVLDHINLLSLKFLMFLYFHYHAINFCSLMLFFFSLFHLCCWWCESHKCINIP